MTTEMAVPACLGLCAPAHSTGLPGDLGSYPSKRRLSIRLAFMALGKKLLEEDGAVDLHYSGMGLLTKSGHG